MKPSQISLPLLASFILVARWDAGTASVPGFLGGAVSKSPTATDAETTYLVDASACADSSKPIGDICEQKDLDNGCQGFCLCKAYKCDKCKCPDEAFTSPKVPSPAPTPGVPSPAPTPGAQTDDTPASTPLAPAPTQESWAKEKGIAKQYAPYIIALILYVALYSIARCEFPQYTAEYEKVHRLMCCWRDVYLGRSCFLYDLVGCPVVIVLHAIRIYLGYCCCVYTTRIYWLLCGKCNVYFDDPEFGPDEKALGDVQGDAANKESGQSSAKAIWVRAMDLRRANVQDKAPHPTLHDTDMRLFRRKIRPHDILQGALGDCWLLAAMAAAADRPGILESLFITDEISPEGRYKVRLYNPQKKEWERITIDDWVPCVRDQSSYSKDHVARDKDGHVLTLYAAPKGKEIWTLILEKAFAKMCGSFAGLDGGCTEWAMQCMTGKDAWAFWKEQDGKWHRYDLVQMENPKNIRDVGWQQTAQAHDSDSIFKQLRFYCRNGAMICCSGIDAEGEARGLVAGHAFTVLQVLSVRKSMTSDEYFRMIKIRNPWGHKNSDGSGEWNGTWADGDEAWEQFPHVKSKCGYGMKQANGKPFDHDDGVFWMEWEDFVTYWNTVSIVDADVNIHTLTTPIHDEEHWYGPCKACSFGCMNYWFPPWCYGIRRLYIGTHDASSRALKSEEYDGKKCGMDASGCYCRLFEVNAIHLES